MTRFTRLEGESDAAVSEAKGWLRAQLEREGEARALFGVAWRIEHGRRQVGAQTDRPRPVQVGFLIHALDPASGAPLPLSCFVAVEDIADEEQRPVVEQVLSLWLDRALEGDGTPGA